MLFYYYVTILYCACIIYIFMFLIFGKLMCAFRGRVHRPSKIFQRLSNLTTVYIIYQTYATPLEFTQLRKQDICWSNKQSKKSLWSEYLVINTLHRRTIRSLGRRVVTTPPTALEIFFFICSSVTPFSSTTRPVRLGLYSLHSRILLIITIHWMRNCSNDIRFGSGSVILFKQKSMTDESTNLSPKE